MSDHETTHRIACARELTYAAGVPLRDRYGFAASEESVRLVVELCFSEDPDSVVADAIGFANFVGDVELADGDVATDEDYDRRIVSALRPLVEQRRAAERRLKAVS